MPLPGAGCRFDDRVPVRRTEKLFVRAVQIAHSCHGSFACSHVNRRREPTRVQGERDPAVPPETRDAHPRRL